MALRLMTLAEIEQEYNISQRTLFRYMQQRRLTGSKVAGRWYIPEHAVRHLFLDGFTAGDQTEGSATEITLKPAMKGSQC